MKAKVIFLVSLLFSLLNATTVHTDKQEYDYNSGESTIHVTFEGMEGSEKDWIGIYPAGASYEFNNVVAWKWTGGVIDGELNFKLLPAGAYDVRAFFNNSLTKKAEERFSIIGQAPVIPDVNLTTDRRSYLNTQTIKVTFQHMQGNETDWIGVYPAGASYEFENVVAYKQTDGEINGSVDFKNLPIGDYDIRAFFNNKLSQKASTPITVITDPNHHNVELSTDKTAYLNSETVQVNFRYMQGNPTDWIGVYPAGASYEFENVVAYKQTDGEINGSVDFKKLPVGDYDIRAFFNNKLSKKASITIRVTADPSLHDVVLVLDKSIYAQNELVYINYDYMQGNETDWIGIYPAGASYEFENVIDWKYTKGKIKGELSLGGFSGQKELSGSMTMPGLSPGNYEIRAFFNNSLSKVKVVPFKVVQQEVNSTVYERAEGSISPNWIHVSGRYPPVYYNGVVRLRARWISSTTNTSEYTLPFDTPNQHDKVLELDVGGMGRWTPHFNIGVLVETLNGKRRMLWDSYLNHYRVKANRQGSVLSFPTYVELQRNTAYDRKHFRVNLDKYLRILEPDNKVLSVTAFFATGGDLDNIKLSSH